jgi:EVE domain
MRYWINVVSREHVERGVAGGFTQADHGKPTRLRRLGTGDAIAFYSPRTALRGGEPLQQLTALGTIGDDLYQVEMAPGFEPWRRSVEFVSVIPAPIRPLLPRLSFVPDSGSWGMVFRRGLFEIPAADFAIVARAMERIFDGDL